MIKRRDVLVIAIVLGMALLAYGGMLLSRRGQTAGENVAVYTGSTLYRTASLAEDQTIRVEQPGGEINEVVIEGGAVRMGYSSCRNQLCVHQGAVTAENWTRRAMGRSIICLPNQVVVELLLGSDHPTLRQEDVADI